MISPNASTPRKAPRSARRFDKAWRFLPSLLLLEVRLVPAFVAPATTTFLDPQLGTFPPAQHSLREVIQEVNAINDTNATINLQAGTYLLQLPQQPGGPDTNATGDLELKPAHVTTITITGTTDPGNGAPTTIIDAQGLDRVLHIIPGADVQITLNNLIIQHGSTGGSAGFGGGIFLDDAGLTPGVDNLNLNNCAVQDNEASQGGGGIFSYTGNITLGTPATPGSGTAVNINATAGPGGGVATYLGAFNAWSNSLVQGNVASGSGGGVYLGGDVLSTGLFQNGSMTLDGILISNNTSGGNGGGFFDANIDASLSVQGASSVVNNTAHLDGGGLAVQDAVFSVLGSNISSNHAGLTGGGVDYDGAAGRITVAATGGTVSTFNSNTSGNGGGAISNNGASTVNISGSSFDSNNTVGDGGAVLDTTSTTFIVNGSSFTNNNAHGGSGGGLALESSGSVYNLGQTSSVILNANRSGGGSGGQGGGIYNNVGNSFELDNALVNGNIGSAGGGVFTGAHTVSINSSIISNNIANTFGAGGGVDNFALTGAQTTTLTMVNNLFAFNVASNDGGGLDSHATTANLNTITFVQNVAAGNGGGLAYFGTNLRLQNTSGNYNSFIDNIAGDNGGGLYADVPADGSVAGGTNPSIVNVNNSFFPGNHAGERSAGIYFNSSSGGTLKVQLSSLVLGTSGLSGGGISSNAATNWVVNDVITNNATTQGGGGIELRDNGAGNQVSSVLQNYIASNYAGGGGDGGGILDSTGGYLQVVNDTIAMNTAGLNGGGIATEGVGANVHTDVLFTTITGNLAGKGGGIFNSQTTSAATTGAAVAVGLGNTIVAGNYAAPDAPVFPLPVGGYVNGYANGYALFGLFSDTLTTPAAGANVPNPGSTGVGGIVGHNYIDPAPGIGASTLSAGNDDQINAPASDYNVPPFVGTVLSLPAYNGGPILPGVFGLPMGDFFSEAPIGVAPANPIVDDAVINAVVMNFFGGPAGTVIDQAGHQRPLVGPQPPPFPAGGADVADLGALEVT